MILFLKRVVYFFIPVILIFLFPLIILFISKEYFYEVDKIVIKNKPYIIGYAFNGENDAYFKWYSVCNTSKKKIWALGSSRVLSFRNIMFDSTFYNVGGTISNISDFYSFLKNVPKDVYPDYLIIGLDQWMFNEAWNNFNVEQNVSRWNTKSCFYPNFTKCLRVYKSLKDKAISFPFKNSHSENGVIKIGLSACYKNSGYINDGSYYYGDQISKLIKSDSTANDFGYYETMNRINQGINRFQYGNFTDKKAFRQLDHLLKYCRDNNIFVVAFLPPFAEKVYKKMGTSKNYLYLNEILPLSKKLFNKYGFEIYDFSSISTVNSSDSETIDGFHGSEKTYLKLLIKILETNSRLNFVANIQKLNFDLESCKNNFIVYSK
jgi:hypothetical protein